MLLLGIVVAFVLLRPSSGSSSSSSSTPPPPVAAPPPAKPDPVKTTIEAVGDLAEAINKYRKLIEGD